MSRALCQALGIHMTYYYKLKNLKTSDRKRAVAGLH